MAEPTDRVAVAPQVKVAVVLGLSHSGSTILDLTLGSHPAIIGAGEILGTLRESLPHVLEGGEWTCSCGENIRRCTFWGELVNRIETPSAVPSVSNWYRSVIERVRRQYPEGTLLLDSSKRMEAVDALCEVPEVDLRVLLLVRDVRGWMASASDRELKRRRRRHKRLGIDSASPSLRRSAADWLWGSSFGLSWLWKSTYAGLLDELAARALPTFVVSYEKLCLQEESTLSSILDFLSLDSYKDSLSPSRSGSHIALGNRIRLRQDNRERIAYDTRWLKRMNWAASYLLMPSVRRLNKDLAWNNTGTLISPSEYSSHRISGSFRRVGDKKKKS